ncbi:hypothetical protein P153DRAFT_283136 [Dothidotthia symphoricarpi CBS 119687]|uniref:Nucleolar protein 12 n=1 Tax=Dothidotthia symphoricarpi CBS 119687 TaxID=1392245 RepID=A0A6A6ANY2_9PLEO|nr:uncharacterized protein P153DRAFT_283136 [Dothidotthia symphoricarpi CBS 119687]KAF2132755.1 hypothetical protein P153DRAFT_283136 [Dothidotthia symphoricarpi CBS 119687]
MAKSKDKRPAKQESQKKGDKPFIAVDKKAFDPSLSSLFASSAGPVQPPPKSRYQEPVQKRPAADSPNEEEDDEELSALSDADSSDEEEASEEEASEGDDDSSSEEEQSESENEAVLAKLRESMLAGESDKPNKKRKRGGKEEIEETYMRKLAREEEKDEEKRLKKRKTEELSDEEEDEDEDEDEDEEMEDKASDKPAEREEEFTIPKHESLAETDGKNAQELDKAARTVFLGNVSSDCINSKTAEKALKKHLESFISDLADNNPPHKVESIRFRSTAFGSNLPKRAAFAKKEIMDSTTKSTNAYAVYSTKFAALKAVNKLNGTVFLDRHLHVDSVAHPAKVDHRRCVFVGNLPFVDEVSQAPEADKPAKKKPVADVEEGLWVHFAKAGKIESVRVVRDAQTRIGKGFAYVQFVDENGVEAALQFHEKKYPPLLPRILRVTRCKAEKKKDKPRGPPPSKKSSGVYNAKISGEEKSKQGRAQAMLGKVAAAKTKEAFVFEGHRASERQGKSGLKFGGGGGKKKGPNGRKSRSSTWKKTAGKK